MRKFLLLLTILISLSFAQSCTDSLVTDEVNQEIGYYTGLAFAVVLLVIVSAYLIGTATNNTHVLLFAKDELFHLGISVVLLVSLGAILFFSCTVVSGFLHFAASTVGAGPCFTGSVGPRAMASCYLNDLETGARTALQSTIRESIDLEMDSADIRGVYNPFSGGIMTPLKAYKKTYSMQLDMLGNTFIFPALISISLQRVVIDFLTDDFARYLLALALFFRVLPGTRTMGNLFLAISIVIYIFLPSLYAINAAMDYAIFQGNALGCDAIEDEINDRVLGDCSTPYNYWAIARFLPQAFFFPNLTLAITITFLSAINKALKVLT